MRKLYMDRRGVASPLEFTTAFAVFFVAFALMAVYVGNVLAPFETNNANYQAVAMEIAERLVNNPGKTLKGNVEWELEPDQLVYLGLAMPKPVYDVYFYGNGSIDVVVNNIYKQFDLAVKNLSYLPKKTRVSEGEKLYVSFNVENVGTGNASAFNYTVQIDNHIQYQGRYNKSLSPGEVAIFRDIQVTVPSDGKRSYLLIVSIFPDVTDADQSNDVAYLILLVDGGGDTDTDTDVDADGDNDQPRSLFKFEISGPSDVLIRYLRASNITTSSIQLPQNALYGYIDIAYTAKITSPPRLNSNIPPDYPPYYFTWSGPAGVQSGQNLMSYVVRYTANHAGKTYTIGCVGNDSWHLLYPSVGDGHCSAKPVITKVDKETVNVWIEGPTSVKVKELATYYLKASFYNKNLTLNFLGGTSAWDVHWSRTGLVSEGFNGAWYRWKEPGNYVVSVRGEIDLLRAYDIPGRIPFYASLAVRVNGTNSQSCFLSGTKILLADGSTKNIEEIKVGDMVRSYDTETGEMKVGKVTEVFHHSKEEMGDHYIIINNELKVTPNHPFYVNGRWIQAGEIKVGDVLGDLEVKSVQRVYEKVPTYNIEVEPYHSYILSIHDIVVHNAVGQSSGSASGSVTPYYSLSVGISPSGAGSVSRSPSGSRYQSGTTVTLTAQANEGYRFDHWSGDASGTSSTICITMNSDKCVTAVFKSTSSPSGTTAGTSTTQIQTISGSISGSSGGIGGFVVGSSGSVQGNVLVITGSKSNANPFYVASSTSLSTSLSNSQPNSYTNPCFLSGTKILLADGSTKNIEEIKVGDMVRSYDTETGKLGVGKVTKVFHFDPDKMGYYYLIINDYLRVTPNHLLFANGGWIQAGKIKVGDTLGFGTVVYSVKKVYYDIQEVYDLEVEPYHNFIVLSPNTIMIAHNATAQAVLTDVITSSQLVDSSSSTSSSQLVDSSSSTSSSQLVDSSSSTSSSQLVDSSSSTSSDSEQTLIDDTNSLRVIVDEDETTYVYRGTSIDPSARISLMVNLMYETIPKPCGGGNDNFYREIEYSGSTTFGVPFLRVLMTSTKEVEYSTLMPEKIEALRYIPYEKARDTILGEIGINDVDFNVRITRLDGSDILSYGAQYKESSTALASYSRHVVIYPNEILGYRDYMPAILTVTVFK